MSVSRAAEAARSGLAALLSHCARPLRLVLYRVVCPHCAAPRRASELRFQPPLSALVGLPRGVSARGAVTEVLL